MVVSFAKYISIQEPHVILATVDIIHYNALQEQVFYTPW